MRCLIIYDSKRAFLIAQFAQNQAQFISSTAPPVFVGEIGIPFDLDPSSLEHAAHIYSKSSVYGPCKVKCSESSSQLCMEQPKKGKSHIRFDNAAHWMAADKLLNALEENQLSFTW